MADPSPSATGSADDVARGKYLVGIAGCADCHSPRLANGQMDEAHFLWGTELDFTPTHPVPHWRKKAPHIAGLKKWTDDQALKLFTTGLDKHGEHSDPPMPAYHFTPEDARAVIAYLRSLP